MAKIEINIDDYLSEDDKKQLAIDAFKESIKSELFKASSGSVQSESEVQRIVGNIAYQPVMNYVQEFIPDLESKIKESVKNTLLQDSLSFYLFKKKDAWDRGESLAVTFMNEAVRESKKEFKDRIKEEIKNFDASGIIKEEISNMFEELAGTMGKMADLFLNSNNNL